MTPTININGVNIILTEEQLREIDRQRNTIIYYTQIKSYEDGCKVLNKTSKTQEDFSDIHDWLGHQIRIISKAINELIPSEGHFPDFTNSNQKKWFPRFTYDYVLGGWSFYSYCSGWFSDSISSVGLFKNEESCRYMGETFKHLYIKFNESY